MNSVFHAGELAVQQRAGVQPLAARVGRSIKATIPPTAAQFLVERPFLIIASIDAEERPWASLLAGEPPFIRMMDEHTIQVCALPHESDPLFANLQTGGDVGILAIEFATRRRMRLNGTAVSDHHGFIVQATQVYANCPKYIQAHHLAARPQSEPCHTAITRALSAEQAAWIGTADTFSIASAHAEGGADASHRGGHKGFVQVENRTRLIWPDYVGNKMFNTLGNLAINPHAGLLFLDFAGNRTLQLTGQAEIVWDEAQIAQYAGAERLLLFEIAQVIETQNTLPFYMPANEDIRSR